MVNGIQVYVKLGKTLIIPKKYLIILNNACMSCPKFEKQYIFQYISLLSKLMQLTTITNNGIFSVTFKRRLCVIK